MRQLPTFLALILISTLLTGCQHKPWLYKVGVQQGNLMTEDMLNNIHVGMTKLDVLKVMGEPVLTDAFRPNHWHYVYTLQVNGQARCCQQVNFIFEKGRVAAINKIGNPHKASSTRR